MFKKLMSAMIVSFALMSLLAAVSVSAANLLKNSGFEFGGNNWTVAGGKMEFSKTEKVSGNLGMHISNRTEYYATPQQFLNLKNGETYTVSTWVKLAKGTALMRIAVEPYRTDGSSETIQLWMGLVSTEWKQIQQTFTLNAGEFAKIKILSSVFSSADVYFDDFQVWEGTKAGITPSPLVDGVTEGGIVVNPEGITSKEKETAYCWDFKCNPGTAHSLAGWQVEKGTSEGMPVYSTRASEEMGLTKLTFRIKNARITTMQDKPLGIDADRYKYIKIKAQNNTQSKIFKLGWVVGGKEYCFNVAWPEEKLMQEIILDMSECSQWSGTVDRLIMSPAADVAIDDYNQALKTETVILDSIAVFGSSQKVFVEPSNGAINRGEFVETLVSELGIIKYNTKSTGFRDLGDRESLRNSILAAIETGIVSDDGSSLFNPENSITREHAAIMLMRACSYFDKQTDRMVVPGNFNDASAFTGKKMIDAAYWAVENGIMSVSYGNSFEPQGNVTEAEACDMISRAVDWVNGVTKNGEVFVSAGGVGTYDIVRITAKEENGEAYSNPYDYEEVKADAVFTAPDGTILTIPGYYDMLYDFEYDPRRQIEDSTQKSQWKFRFTPTMPGEWSFEIKRTHNGSVTTLGSGSITAVESGRPGFIRKDESNPRFVYENGDAFFGFGINIFGPEGADGYNFVTHEKYFKNYAQDNGTNLWRIWFDNVKGGLETYMTGIGKFDNVYAQQLDYCILLARQNGVAILPALKTHHMLIDTNSNSYSSVYYVHSDGALLTGGEVYSNPETIKSYKSMLRFVIARYAAYDNLLLWELYNEEELITDWRKNIDDVSAWHDEMLEFLAENDPYNHTKGTSLYRIAGENVILSKEMVDYSTVHSYRIVQPALMIRADAQIKRELYGNKPNLVEELSVAKERTGKNKDGEITHEALWSSIAAGNATATPPWWWDSWMQDNEHWKIYGPISGFLEGLSWPDENLELVNFKTQSAEKGDFVIPAGYFDDVQYNTTALGEAPIKTEFAYDFNENPVRDVTDMIYEYNISKDYEYTFDVNLPKETNFLVYVASATSDSRLSVYVDGAEVYNEPLGAAEVVAKHSIPVPAGEHSIVVKNGASLNITINWVAFENVAPRVAAEGAVGDNSAVIYVRDTKTVYSEMNYFGYEPIKITGAIVDLTGLRDGVYDLIWWDTYNGVEVSREEITVSDGVAPKVEVPAFTRDIAAKLIRRSN